MTEVAIPAGGDGIGLSITVSSEQNDGDDDDDGHEHPVRTEELETPDLTPTFIPPSVNPSPIPFEDGNGNSNSNSNLIGGTTIESNSCATTTSHSIQGATVVQSIMRESSPQQGRYGSVHKEQQPLLYNHHSQDHVAALEDRVRDLEEKLSTLSMLLMQQTNQRPSPRSRHRKTFSSSPESSACDSSSLSPPSTPFRSLASFATIPSSNVPVLESPTPVPRGFRNGHPDHPFGDFALPYEDARSPMRSPQHAKHTNHHRNNNTPSKIGRGLHRSHLSYQILHAPDSELYLRSNNNSCDSRSDTGDSENHQGGSGRSNVKNLQSDDSFEEACRVPSLDSLPGSSRTSPIMSKDPIVSSVLSPDQLEDTKSMAATSSGTIANDSPKVMLGSSSSSSSNHPLRKRNSAAAAQGKEDSTKNESGSGSASKNNNSMVSESSDIPASTTTDKSKKPKKSIKSKWMDYLNSVQESNYDTDKQMEEFVKVPSAVEAVLSFGFWISVDSFLYTLTMLPLRFVYSIFLLMVWFYNKITRRKLSGSLEFHRHNSYHLIQVSTIYIIYAYVLKPIDISIMYHAIRNQSMVKHYLLVAIVEVFDRLLCSLGQDCLDSLYWNTTRRPRSSRLLVSALVVLAYTALHSLLLFVHVATLNVAMNSDDQALLSLLIGGNFAEIKSTVFKKYNKATLFKITASDICERFKLALFLFLVLMLNASQGMDQKMLYNYLSMCGIVVGGEWLSDWLKHSFITKFNYIASGVYAEYSLLLAGDVSGFGHEGENLDKSHAVVKRLGLAQIPLVCVMAKYLKEAYKYQTYKYEAFQPKTWLLVVGALSVWLILLATKLLLASLIVRMSRNKLEAAPEFSKNNTTVAKKKNN